MEFDAERRTIMREIEARRRSASSSRCSNEAGNIAPLVAEIDARSAGTAFEIVYVNDGSTDGTEAELASLLKAIAAVAAPDQARDRPAGSRAAVRTGVAHARAPRWS